MRCGGETPPQQPPGRRRYGLAVQLFRAASLGGCAGFAGAAAFVAAFAALIATARGGHFVFGAGIFTATLFAARRGFVFGVSYARLGILAVGGLRIFSSAAGHFLAVLATRILGLHVMVRAAGLCVFRVGCGHLVATGTLGLISGCALLRDRRCNRSCGLSPGRDGQGQDEGKHLVLHDSSLLTSASDFVGRLKPVGKQADSDAACSFYRDCASGAKETQMRRTVLLAEYVWRESMREVSETPL